MARALLTSPRAVLRLEGAAMLAGATALYGVHGGHWGLFALLLLAPDLSMLGYRGGATVGAACYNAAHTDLVPVALGAVGLAGGRPTVFLPHRVPGGPDLGRPHRAGPRPRLRSEVPRRVHGDTPGRVDHPTHPGRDLSSSCVTRERGVTADEPLAIARRHLLCTSQQLP